MPDTLPFGPTAIVIGALSTACGVLYYDNKYLIREMLKALVDGTAAMRDATAKIEANTQAVARMTEEIRRGS